MAGIRGVALISGGTVAGQALVLLSIPLLARLYSPQDMGLLSVFVSIVGMLSVTAALHYELAIPLPNSARAASALSTLALMVVLVTSLAVGLVLSIGRGAVLDWFGAAELRSTRYLIPVSVLLTGVINVLTLTAVRYQHSGRNAASKAAQGGAQALVQSGAGLAGAGWTGLILGQFAGLAAGILPLLIKPVWFDASSARRSWVRRMQACAHRYRNFPLLAAPSSLVNAVASNIPALLLSGLFGLKVAGLYGIGVRVLQLPVRLVGQAVSQVFLGQAAKARQSGELADIVDPVYRFLLRASLYIFVPIAVLARPGFVLLFGQKWAEAGNYVQYLVPWMIVSFVSMPLSMLVAVLQKQRQELIFQCAYLALIALAIWEGASIGSASIAVALFGSCGAVLLVGKLWWLLGIAGCDRARLVAVTGKELLLALLAGAPLMMLRLLEPSILLVCAIGGAWMVAIHWFNYRFRGVYAF
jgi:O-antigen/teichoic acid export membrane protein